ncbi:MAG: leucine-rich repeat domain-containing protein, partial [Oscillospiraceae bacterium]
MCKRYCIFDKKCYNKFTLFNRNAEHFGGLRTAFCGGRAADKVTAEKTDWEETHEKTTFEFRARGADDRVAPAGHGAGGRRRGSGTCGAEGDGSNLTWTLDSEGVLTISGSGAMHDYDYSSPWHESGNQIQSVFMANGVTSIGNFAFSECTSLTSMTIPDSVTCIGNCAFDSCTSLTSVTIPDSVTSIGVYAFCACTSLKSVTIPDSVTSIGDYAFSYCTSLTGIWVDEGNSHYFSDASGVLFNKDKTVLAQCPGAFSGSYAIPDGVTSINDAAFVNCESLTSVTIPDGVTNIGYEVFAGCTSLANMVLPNGVTRIGAEAFDWCTSMKSITIPDGVTSIGYDAFSNCKSLTNVYFTGTEEAWNGITIDGGNDALKNAKIHCNYVSHTHSYKDVVTAPTCTEKGYTTHTCSCGDSYVDTYVDALGHAWD